MPIQNIIILIAALSGFGVAFYIAITKMKAKPLICPIGSDCTVVVTSDYSKMMGIPLEYLGLLYYSFVIFCNLFFFYSSESLTPFFSQAIFVISGGALLMSLYLTSIQLFKLKHWCTWCLFSAFFTLVIFIAMMMK